MRQKYSKGILDQEYLEAQAAYDQAIQNFNNASAEFVDAAIFELNAAVEKLQRAVKTPKDDGSGWWKQPISKSTSEHSFRPNYTHHIPSGMSIGGIN